MARRTEEVKPLSETPSTKPQAPEKFRNRNAKNQTPNTKEIPSSKLQTTARASSLELLWSLELGVWDLVLLWSLEFGIWSFLPGLSASQFEMRPVIIGIRRSIRHSAFVIR